VLPCIGLRQEVCLNNLLHKECRTTVYTRTLFGKEGLRNIKDAREGDRQRNRTLADAPPTSGEAVLEEPELAASAQPQAVVSSPAIAFTLPLPLPPVTNELRRLGVNKISRLEFGPSVERYEHNRPGETIHLDIKKLGRIGVVGHRITGERSQRKCKPLRRPPLPPVPCSGSQAGLKGMA